MTVCCVLRSGGDYDARYVRRLCRGLSEHLNILHRFVCLTDLPSEVAWADPVGHIVEPLPLEHDWPGWWAKMEIFRIPGPLLYFDLDTVIVGDITPLAKLLCEGTPETFVGLRDFYTGRLQSAILGWSGDVRILYDRFAAHAAEASWNPGRIGPSMTHMGRHHRGDQDWLSMTLTTYRTPVGFIQDVFPGVYSAKADIHAKHGGKLPADARIVCFHGHPRPAELIPAPAWLREHWGDAA